MSYIKQNDILLNKLWQSDATADNYIKTILKLDDDNRYTQFYDEHKNMDETKDIRYILSQYQEGDMMWSEDRDKIQKAAKLKAQMYNLFREAPPTPTDIYVFRCEATRSMNSILNNPIINSVLSTTFSRYYAFIGEFCFNKENVRNRLYKSCTDKSLWDKNRITIAIHIPKGSHVIPIFSDFMHHTHGYYKYQKELLLPPGGMLEYTGKCYDDKHNNGMTFIPIFKYSDPINYINKEGKLVPINWTHKNPDQPTTDPDNTCWEQEANIRQEGRTGRPHGRPRKRPHKRQQRSTQSYKQLM